MYAYLAKGRDENQLRELEMALAPTPAKAQESVDRANMEAMKQLQAMLPAAARPPRLPRG